MEKKNPFERFPYFGGGGIAPQRERSVMAWVLQNLPVPLS